MVKFDKSTVNPSGELRNNASKKSVCVGMGASNGFYSSRMSTLGNTSLGSSRIAGMSFHRSRTMMIKTTLKHDLKKSRILDAEIFDLSGQDATSQIYESLFSTSEHKVRAPQNDAQFSQRVLDDGMKRMKLTDESVKKAQLKDFIQNTGFEFDNEQVFYDNRKALLRSVGVLAKMNKLPDLDEEE